MRPAATRVRSFAVAAGVLAAAGCASSSSTMAPSTSGPTPSATMAAPSPDPRVGLGAGLMDAEEATWNMRVVSETPPAEDFVGVTNSDLAFTGKYAIQGNYNGYQVWDISNPAQPVLAEGYVCPASQSDVSVYKNLLFVSGEGMGGRLDCGTEGVQASVSPDRLRGIRIFDISDIHNPRYIANVQTCRGSHTHTVVAPPNDPANVYIYVSGSSAVRPAEELPGCSGAMPSEDPNSALFRIEVIRVPLAHPEQAAIVSSPHIFDDLTAPPHHGLAPADRAEVEKARAQGAFVASIMNEDRVLPDRFAAMLLDSIVVERGGTAGQYTAQDSATLRQRLPAIIQRMIGNRFSGGPTQCHDITVYPAKGLAGGACEGYGLLLDISDPVHPRRIDAVSDSNFSYWHSATFNNDATKVLFSDEWGGGGGPKCRATDPMEWGADAIFTLDNRRMDFRGYYKMPAPQTEQENCVAHNGSLIPVPGRDVMVQSWYQGGVSVFDWTDGAHPKEIAFFDRGPVNAEHMASGGTWSAYWYNGVIVSSEISRGLDILELTPSPMMTRNEIDAAKSARLEYLNTQGQQQYTWPATFALARAYLDQLQRSGGLSAATLRDARHELGEAEEASGGKRGQILRELADDLQKEMSSSRDAAKVQKAVDTLRSLAG